MKKTCLTSIAVFLGFAVLLVVALATLWPEVPNTTPPRPPLFVRLPGAAPASLFAALFLSLAAASGVSVVDKLRERSLVGRSLAGRQPEDGRRTAACGILVGDGPPLTAPFSGSPCVTYHYQITHVPSRGKSTYTDCWGYALAPSYVETASGVVRILGYTDFDFRPTRTCEPEHRECAKRYFAATKFVTIGFGALSSAWSAFKDVVADDDGTIRADFGPPPPDLDEPKYTLEEQSVGDREAICAFGVYSASRGGLVPVPGSRDVFPVRVLKGSGESVRGRLLRGAIGQVVLAVVFAAAAGGIVVAFLHFLRTL